MNIRDRLPKIYLATTQFLNRWGMSVVVLIMRLWIAQIFFLSGLTKIHDWHTAMLLFAEEYHVPFIPPQLAAIGATAVELTCPILLVIGLASRLATLPMLAMTVIIHFTYMMYPEHCIWVIFLMTILCYGPGIFSLDALIKQKLGPK